MRPLLILATMAAALPAFAAPAGPLAPAQMAAAMRAAGLSEAGGTWRSETCRAVDPASPAPARLETQGDLDGDGLPEALILEGGPCWGTAGQAFWLVSQRAEGGWALMAQGIGVPRLLATRGTGGWPDIEVGGPGQCLPILRWNG
ncbi:MAG: hypothetical protein ACK40H_09825, partial [Sphingomonadaceae bacterium]